MSRVEVLRLIFFTIAKISSVLCQSVHVYPNVFVEGVVNIEKLALVPWVRRTRINLKCH